MYRTSDERPSRRPFPECSSAHIADGARSGPAASPFSILAGARDPALIRDEILCEFFAASVAAGPDRICLIDGARRLTYAQVDEAATAIARGLLRLGVGPGDIVGLWMARGAALLIAQIAIAKTGAAWLPFDADAPVERVAVCLADAQAKALVAGDEHFPKAHGAVGCAVARDADLVDVRDERIVDARAAGCTPDHPAYLIYTSGSTGTPKGIVVAQRNICHYLRSANEVYGLRADDVVFQGASVAFDLSMEEIWLPYLVGAALFVATPEMMGEAEKLPDVLEAAGVTVLDTVPTLLALLPRDVASLRIIILGGEACPASVAERWSRVGRVIFNSYGPTETTVVATIAEVVPGQPVTIGKPISNYTCYVVDDRLNLLPVGSEGELLIGGPGVAAGYLKRPELTAQKFIANPFGGERNDPVLYRTGDAVMIDAAGDIHFRGRIDDQVKIRGFRVELGEIETRLAARPGVAQAAVILRNDDGIDQLVAFLVADEAAAPDAKALRGALREQLPSYMIPSRFEVLTQLPRLPSGKLDRKALKSLPLSAPTTGGDEQEEPRSETEAKLLEAARAVLPPQTIPFDADFFTDLGGHSLLAAKFVSILRQTPALATVTLQDLYAARSLRRLGEILDDRAYFADAAGPNDLSFTPPPFLRRFMCGAAQAVALVFIYGLVTMQWLGLFLSTILIIDRDLPIWREMLILPFIYVVINFAIKAIAIALKWIVLGRTKPGVYPLWGAYYFRLWFVERLVQVSKDKFLQCSPLIRWYLRAMGAKVGRDAMIGEMEVGAIDLISIGDNASTGLKNKFANIEVIGDQVHVGVITIGAGVATGNGVVMSRDVFIGDDAQVRDLSALAPGAIVGAAEIWDGSPAKKTGMVDVAALPPIAEASKLTRFMHACYYSAAYVLLMMFGLLPIFPAFYVLYNLDALINGVNDYDVSWAMLPLLAWPAAFVLVVVSMIAIVSLRWIVLPRVRSGVYSIHSTFYLRKWTLSTASEVILETLSGLYATVYMRHWYRAMGARIGKGTEISTNLSGRFDLVDIGADNFLGDECIFGDEELHRGWMTLHEIKTGDRVFIGNDSVIPAGAIIGDGALVGVKSKMPEGNVVKPGETWFGSPSISIPNRQKVDVPAHWTYRPPLWFRVFRYFFEAFHTSLPTALFIVMAFMTADVVAEPVGEGKWALALIYILAAGVIMAMAAICFCAAVKWITMGVYKPTMKPMWSFWAMRTEMVAVLYGGMVGKASSEYLRGTPFLPWALRLYGCKIGKGVWMDLTDVTEFDCVKIGDFAALNMTACLQTHLYEDRIMKVGRIEVGKGVTVGWCATVLYDSKVGDFAQIAPLTVVMKGENIPAHTAWAGAPAQPAKPVILARRAEMVTQAARRPEELAAAA